MLNILITFDYEIFFGKNFATEKEILFDTTDELMSILDKNKIRGIFFADVLSVEAYKNNNPDSDYPLCFGNQIRKMINHGHDVQLHIHPHWITAQYDSVIGQWKTDLSTYRIHSFFENNGTNVTAEEIIERGISYLYDTIKPIDSNYECYAYRAGGYCIQPEEKLFSILAKKGIEIDSSVCIGKKLITESHYFDYDKEFEKLNWEIASGIIELPIGSVNNNLFKRLIPGTGYRTLIKEPAKGEGIAGTTKPMHGKLYRLMNYNHSKKEFGLEFMHYKQMIQGLKKYYHHYECEKNERYVAIICHPKSMDNISMKNMEEFIDIISKSNWARFSTLKEMRETIKRSDSVYEH